MAEGNPVNVLIDASRDADLLVAVRGAAVLDRRLRGDFDVSVPLVVG